MKHKEYPKCEFDYESFKYPYKSLFKAADKSSLVYQVRSTMMELYIVYPDEHISIQRLADEINKLIERYGDGSKYTYNQIYNCVDKILVPSGYIVLYQYTYIKGNNCFVDLVDYIVWHDTPKRFQ